MGAKRVISYMCVVALTAGISTRIIEDRRNLSSNALRSDGRGCTPKEIGERDEEQKDDEGTGEEY